jgi:hypothetical protein
MTLACLLLATIRTQEERLNDVHLELAIQLLNREWWTRVWVHQDLTLSKTATFYCGPRSLDQDSILRRGQLYSLSKIGIIRKYIDVMELALNSLHFLDCHGQRGSCPCCMAKATTDAAQSPDDRPSRPPKSKTAGDTARNEIAPSKRTNRRHHKK